MLWPGWGVDDQPVRGREMVDADDRVGALGTLAGFIVIRRMSPHTEVTEGYGGRRCRTRGESTGQAQFARLASERSPDNRFLQAVRARSCWLIRDPATLMARQG